MGPEPDPAQVYLYVSRPPHGIRRIDYDLLTGAFSNRVDLFPSLRGNDIALRTNTLGQTELYASESYRSANVPSRTLVRLRRFVDRNGDGIFGSIGDTDAAIAQSIPQDSHSLNQIQILDNTLYVGNGTRTENGALEASSDNTFGESAFGGAILIIDDLDAVATIDDAAGFPAYLPNSTDAQYEDMIDGTAPGTDAPYTSSASNKLRVHSAGTRNPFGVATDRHGALWFTANFHQVNNSAFNRSLIDGGGDVEAFDGSSNDDIHDQLFRAIARADDGYRNGNWQADPTARFSGRLETTSTLTSAATRDVMSRLTRTPKLPPSCRSAKGLVTTASSDVMRSESPSAAAVPLSNSAPSPKNHEDTRRLGRPATVVKGELGPGTLPVPPPRASLNAPPACTPISHAPV